MASSRFAGLVLGIIIVSLALKYSFACAHEGTTRKDKWLAGIASQNHASPENDFLNDISGAASANIAGRKELKGRKMGALEKLAKEQSERKQGPEANPRFSGNSPSKRTSKGATQDRPLEAQVSEKGMTFPSSKPLDPLQDTTKSFLDAADEVVRVMHRDYMVNDPPHRSPPVNNHEPTD